MWEPQGDAGNHGEAGTLRGSWNSQGDAWALGGCWNPQAASQGMDTSQTGLSPSFAHPLIFNCIFSKENWICGWLCWLLAGTLPLGPLLQQQVLLPAQGHWSCCRLGFPQWDWSWELGCSTGAPLLGPAAPPSPPAPSHWEALLCLLPGGHRAGQTLSQQALLYPFPL